MSNDVIDDRDELMRRIDELTKAVEMLQAQLAPTDSAESAAPVTATGSRRDILRLAGTAAAGAVAGTVLAAAAPRPAAAATGQNMLLGNFQTATNMTYLGYGAGTLQVPHNVINPERTMFWIDGRSTPIDSNGIRGDGRGPTGIGLWGNSDFNGTGVFGNGGFGLRGSGTKAALHLQGTNAAPPTRSDSHVVGEIDIDSSGYVWLCVVAGTPGTWRRIGGPATAGAFHAIDPVRAHDSRWPGGSRIASGDTRLISVADGHNILTGLVDAPNSVPVGSTAVAYNLTVTGTLTSGFLTLAPGTATGITASSINWSGDGQNLANGAIVAVDGSRQVRVFAGGGGSTDFVIDIAGYFL
jgi:hypothetical protein